MTKNTKELADTLKGKKGKKGGKPGGAPQDGVSTGSALLNMAFSGRPDWGIPKGVYTLFVGDSSTRKTWLCMTILAEAARNPAFKDYRLRFHNGENGSLMDIRSYFGSKLMDRIEITEPSVQEAFYDDLDASLKTGPVIEILDSMDSLVPEAYISQVEKERKARAARSKGKQVEESGSYGTDKAKINSQRLRVSNNYLRKHDSILVIISQTRHNIGFNATFNPKTRSGGDALRFYARLEAWLSLKETLKVKYRGKDHPVGQVVRFKMAKNHVCGWEGGRVDLTFYRKTGLDDIGSCVDYLVDNKHWETDAGGILATEVGHTGPRDEIVKAVEDAEMEDDVHKLVERVWRDIEAACTVSRKRRYE